MPSSVYDSLGWLDENHFEAINRALRNVLATDLALQTYAQILDGLPLSRVARESSRKIYPQHPIKSHVVLCSGVMEKAVQIRRDFDLAVLKFNPKLLEAFQTSPRKSRSFELRLIELTAVALHQIGVLLVHQDLRLHDPATTESLDIAAITSWERPPDMWVRVTPYPTLFTQTGFTAFEQYPAGVADMVGYWAEDRILGGVALFDRSQSWDNVNEPNVYFQSGRVNVTSRIYQLLGTQQQELLNFLLADTEQSQGICPLPILPSGENRVRIDPVDAIPLHKVYRDPWERKELKLRYRMQQYMEPCTRDPLDYPEIDVDAELERLNSIIRRE